MIKKTLCKCKGFFCDLLCPLVRLQKKTRGSSWLLFQLKTNYSLPTFTYPPIPPLIDCRFGKSLCVFILRKYLAMATPLNRKKNKSIARFENNDHHPLLLLSYFWKPSWVFSWMRSVVRFTKLNAKRGVG